MQRVARLIHKLDVSWNHRDVLHSNLGSRLDSAHFFDPKNIKSFQMCWESWILDPRFFSPVDPGSGSRICFFRIRDLRILDNNHILCEVTVRLIFDKKNPIFFVH